MSVPRRSPSVPVAVRVRRRIAGGGERFWRFRDFPGLSPAAVAQSLSRLARQGEITRLGKGLYYCPQPTLFGTSTPNPATLRQMANEKGGLFPAGIAAANLLGLTDQNGARPELATCRSSVPRLLIGPEAHIRTRRPAAWGRLSETEGAILDFLRRRGETSTLTPRATVQRLLKLCAVPGRFARLVRAAGSEPPRVRAMLGAIGEHLTQSPALLQKLKRSLNRLSRFDFGALVALPCAGAWQAR